MHTLDTMTLTYKSYMEAFAKLAKVFPKVEKYDSGYTHCLGTDFRATSTKFNMATDCHIHIEGLFYVGKPRTYEPQTFVAKSSFVKIEFKRSEVFQVHYIDGGETKKQEQWLTVRYGDCGFGLANWEARKQKIIELADKCSGNVKEKITEAIEKADKEVVRWKEAWSDPTEILTP